MKIMNRKLSLLPILLIAVVSGTLVIAQVLFSVQMPSSVTVKTVGEIVVTDLSGNPLASLVFGEIDPDGAGWVAIEVLVRNLSNTELKLDITSTSIIPFYTKANNIAVNEAPLAAGAELKVELMLLIEGPVDAGIHYFEVHFIGST